MRKVKMLLLKHSEQLAEDNIRQQKIKVLVRSIKSQADVGLQAESAGIAPLQAPDGRQENALAADSEQAISCQPAPAPIAIIEVLQ